MIKDYCAPCFTLSEAESILGITGSELKHLVVTGEVNAVLFTKKKPMLLFRTEGENAWVGYATCLYRGHMELHKNVILSLLDNQTIILGSRAGLMLDEDGVTGLSTHYPFQKPLPHLPLSQWKSNSLVAIENLFLTPLPEEKQDPIKSIKRKSSQFLDVVSGRISIEDVKDIPENLILDFNTNSRFRPEDLRIPESELKRYRQRLKVVEQKKAIVQEIDKATSSSGGRENQLHALLGRIVSEHENVKAKEAWRLLEHDSVRERPLFDRENILRVVDSDCIEWVSRNGTESSMNWASFQGALSKIKRKKYDEK